MIADSSAWIEFLRETGSAAHLAVRRLIVDQDTLSVPEVVVMELTTGPTDEDRARSLSALLHRFEVVPIAPAIDSALAASLYRTCRREGETVRNLVDCMVAATALRIDQPVLHRDRDFEVLARRTGVRTVSTLR